jgi:hypothetical protein
MKKNEDETKNEIENDHEIENDEIENKNKQ